MTGTPEYETYTRTVRDFRGERQETVTVYEGVCMGRKATFTATSEEAAMRQALDFFKASRSAVRVWPKLAPSMAGAQ